MADTVLNLDLVSLHTALLSGQASDEHFLVRLRAATAQTTPLKLQTVLVLDTSGSMEGDPLAHVKLSVERLTKILQEGDSLAVVSFANTAQIVSAMRPINENSRREIVKEVRELRANGGTNIEAGLTQAISLLPPSQEGTRQVILLLSDGQPNDGLKTPQELSEKAKKLRAKDIVVSSLGFGASHDGQVLNAVADGGGGQYSFVRDPRLSDKSFAAAIGSQRDIVAKRVYLLLSTQDGVEISKLYGNPEQVASSLGIRLPLSDFLAGETRNLTGVLRVPATTGTRALCKVTLCWQDSATGEEHTVVSMLTLGTGARTENTEVRVQVVLAQAETMREEAQQLGDHGRFQEAQRILEKAKKLIEETPGFVAGQASLLNDAWDTLVDDIQVLEDKPSLVAYEFDRKSQISSRTFMNQGLKSKSATYTSVNSSQMMAVQIRNLQGPPPRAKLTVYAKTDTAHATPEQVISLTQDITIGRSANNDIQVTSDRLSKHHCQIFVSDRSFYVVDYASTNGTFVNNQRIQSPRRLRSGDVIGIGDKELVYTEEP